MGSNPTPSAVVVGGGGGKGGMVTLTGGGREFAGILVTRPERSFTTGALFAAGFEFGDSSACSAVGRVGEKAEQLALAAAVLLRRRSGRTLA